MLDPHKEDGWELKLIFLLFYNHLLSIANEEKKNPLRLLFVQFEGIDCFSSYTLGYRFLIKCK